MYLILGSKNVYTQVVDNGRIIKVFLEHNGPLFTGLLIG